MNCPKTTVLSQTLTGGEMTRRIQILFFACWSLFFSIATVVDAKIVFCINTFANYPGVILARVQ